jgi:tetratricopeptide (TPR) repeat protein
VAAHLRATFANDGEEVADVIARHYLDALAAVPDDPDTAQIREEALAALVRAAERADESGAPTRAAETYAEAAELTEQMPTRTGAVGAAGWWERAAATATLGGDFERAITYADRARALYLANGQTRAAARADVTAARGLRRTGRHTEARQRLNDALAVLGSDADHDTVEAMAELVTLETFGGDASAYALASEALALGQALDVSQGRLAELFIGRGQAVTLENRHAEAVADLEYAARLAERAGETRIWCRAMTNAASVLLATDPAASGAASRAVIDRARQLGDRLTLAVSLANHAAALTFAGNWDEVEREMQRAVEADGFDDDSLTSGYVAIYRILIPALRGDFDMTAVAGQYLVTMKASEGLQDLAMAELADAIQAAGGGRPRDALTHALIVLDHAKALGVASETMMLAWPIAVRSAFELGDAAAVSELLAQLDVHPAGHIPPLLRAEQTLARARLRAAAGDPDADAAFATAIAGHRAFGSPYHLAHALLDRADYLAASGRSDEAESLRDEARQIAERLGAIALRTRAEAVLSG